jgi:hypothetical protein
MLPQVPGVKIVSVTKPHATKDHQCAWNPEHTIKTGQQHIKVAWKDRRADKDNPMLCSDRVCIDCWTKD